MTAPESNGILSVRAPAKQDGAGEGDVQQKSDANASGPVRPSDAEQPAEAMLWCRQDLANALRVAIATFARMAARGAIGPTPIRLSKQCVRYRREECEEWIRAGCPPRSVWERRSKRGGRF
jgi:predicted DNA-binding transcriptional regulator AlpA